MSKDILDSKRAPVDRVAARVLAKGEHWEPVLKPDNTEDSEFPLPVLEYWQLDKTRKEQHDRLVGQTVGRFTVLGIAVHQPEHSSKGLRFVLRCACGSYAYRRSKSIRNPKNSHLDACRRCRELLYLQRNEEYRRTGKNKSDQMPSIG